jgi:uncharacterized protein YqhQ
VYSLPQPRKSTIAYGGQAVIEGVMFAGKTVNVTAVRRKNNEIAFLEVPRKDWKSVSWLKRIPLIRGLIGIVESTAKGSQHLNFSAEVYAEEEESESNETEGNGQHSEAKNSKKETGALSNFTIVLSVAIVGVLTFIAGKLIFTLFPAAVEGFLFGHLFENQILHNLIEGVIKMIFLLIYLFAISQTPIIKRLFQYHGAEHKVISAYEAGLPLTVENVQKFNTLHYRCGSSFIVFTVILGVIIYSFMPYSNIWERLLQRIMLLPVVIGVSYEVLKLTNSVRNTPVLRVLGYPGLWLQLLTTREPDDDQVEVAIASFQRVLELDGEQVEPAPAGYQQPDPAPAG